MWCWPAPEAARGLSWLLLPLALLARSAVAGGDAYALEPLWLDVHPASWAPAESTLLERDADGRLWASAQDLANWGLVEPAGTPRVVEQVAYYPLAEQPRVSSRLDPGDQSLWLDVDPQLRTIQVRSLRAPLDIPGPARGESGGWIDGDVQATRDGYGTQISSLLSGQFFNDAGLGRSQLLLDGAHALRLETNWTRDEPESLRRLSLGDGISSAGAWGRATRFGGLSWGTDFSLRPDLITFPLPQLRGVATLPSTLDVYVDGVLARREPVEAGPFTLSDIPAQTGQGEARVVVRDLLGREQVLTQGFYAAPQLLRPGLQDWRLDGGFLREDYGLASNHYGAAAGIASLRRGISEILTLEWRGEVEARRQVLGSSAALALPFGGVGELAFAAGQGGQGFAALLQTGFEFRGPPESRGLSIGGRARRVSSQWTDLGQTRPGARLSLDLHVGFAPAPGWSAAVTAVHSESREQPGLDLVALDVGTRLSNRWFLSSNAGVTDTDRSDRFLGLSLVGSFGGGTGVADFRDEAGGTRRALEWQHNAREALDDRYRLRAEDGAMDRLVGEGEWTRSRGSLGVALGREGADTALRASASTALAWLGDDAFWTRAGQDGFAVVDTHGLSDVGVLQDHRLAARTDERGLALLPGLRPYQANTIGLVDDDIPIDADVRALEQQLVPQARGGVRVDFPVRAARARESDAEPVTLAAAPAAGPP